MNELKTWIKGLGTDAMGSMLGAVMILVIGIVLIRLIMKIVNRALERSRLEKAAHILISSLTRVVLYLLLGLMIASGLGIDVTAIVALTSVLSLAVSLSIQDALTNIIGGFTLLYTKPFVSGDYVEMAGQAGTVQEIGLAYTRLTTPDNKLISLPNSTVVASQIVNYTTTGTRRVEVVVNAAYSAPVQKVMDALVLAGTVDNVLLEPAPVAVISEYGESAVKYSLRVWVKTENYWDVYFTILQKVRKIFEEQEIPMTYPHLNVHLDK